MGEPLGVTLREGNLRRAFEIVDGLPKDDMGVPRYRGDKELRKWKAAAFTLAEELRRLAHNTRDE
jgi:hypothetical protein